MQLLFICVLGTKCAPLPTDLFLYSYEAEFMHKPIKGFTDTKYFNLTYRYINDVLFTNNPNLAIKIPLICPKELERTISLLLSFIYKFGIGVWLFKTNTVHWYKKIYVCSYCSYVCYGYTII
jgi:hypothetical protein